MSFVIFSWFLTSLQCEKNVVIPHHAEDAWSWEKKRGAFTCWNDRGFSGFSVWSCVAPTTLSHTPPKHMNIYKNIVIMAGVTGKMRDGVQGPAGASPDEILPPSSGGGGVLMRSGGPTEAHSASLFIQELHLSSLVWLTHMLLSSWINGEGGASSPVFPCLSHLLSLFLQPLTKSLLAAAFLSSFGSSLLYGYNLAVVNSPAEVGATASNTLSTMMAKHEKNDDRFYNFNPRAADHCADHTPEGRRCNDNLDIITLSCGSVNQMFLRMLCVEIQTFFGRGVAIMCYVLKQWTVPAHTALSMWEPELSHAVWDNLSLFQFSAPSLSSDFLSYLFCGAVNTTFECKDLDIIACLLLSILSFTNSFSVLDCQSNRLLYSSNFIALDHD